jgi:hypothetical protein
VHAVGGGGEGGICLWNSWSMVGVGGELQLRLTSLEQQVVCWRGGLSSVWLKVEGRVVALNGFRMSSWLKGEGCRSAWLLLEQLTSD